MGIKHEGGTALLDSRSLGRTRVKQLCAAAFLLALAFIVLLQSPLRPRSGGLSGTDSTVFQTVAVMMRRGCMPYRDSFDHKGPLLYLIDYLGALVYPRRGIWLVELASASVTLGAMYRVSRLCCGRVGSCLATAAAAMPLLNSCYNFFEGGNLVEEYAMPFIAVAAYIFLDYLIREHVTPLRLAVCGFCLGCVCLLRVNMIAVWIVFCLAIAGRCIVKKDFAQLGTFILYFLAGFAAIVIPVLVWLAANGALLPFWQDYVLFNMLYADRQEGSALAVFRSYAEKPLILLPLLYTVFAALAAKARERLLYWAYLACLLLSLLLVSTARFNFPHYAMVLVPLLAFPIASLCQRAGGVIAALSGGLGPKVAAAALSVVAVYCYCSTAYNNLNTVISFHDQALVDTVCSIVRERTGPDDSISVFGNWDVIYLESSRPHATTYSYQSPICSVSQAIIDDYFAQLGREQPKVIVLSRRTSSKMVVHYNAMESFLGQYGYAEVWAQGTDYNDGAVIYALTGEK